MASLDVERVFTDMYYNTREWLIALRYTLPMHGELENRIKSYAHSLSHALTRFLRIPERERLVLEGMLMQFLTTLLEIAHRIQIKASVEELYLFWRDIAREIAHFIHRHYPCVKKSVLVEDLLDVVRALRYEMCNILTGTVTLEYPALVALRHFLNHLLHCSS